MKARAEKEEEKEKKKTDGTDRTLTNLFWSWWSRKLLETRKCLVGNAIWGVRRSECRGRG